ncbi:hypothetical protein N7520_008194 [Penicillium odoratum]|uniref:uncharacterized protein n=1 Tax=Penicillium odoratum TaxID=1167516 RepID=UPI002547D12E|nr:uncharacterized protein N7520_008194 [Penicillium odoratum]KAJ5761038.1 hypothetical protein N7520_008194 [Penicillium odoratum]
MPMIWDHAADLKLLIAFSTTGSPDFAAVANLMGDGVSVSAIKHRLVRIREQIGMPSARQVKQNTKTRAQASGSGSASASASSSGKSRIQKTAAGAKGPVHAAEGLIATAGKGKRKAESSDEEEEGEDEEMEEEAEEDEDEGGDYYAC